MVSQRDRFSQESLKYSIIIASNKHLRRRKKRIFDVAGFLAQERDSDIKIWFADPIELEVIDINDSNKEGVPHELEIIIIPNSEDEMVISKLVYEK